MKESYRQNLISRIQKYKGRKRISLSSNESGPGQRQDVPDEITPKQAERIKLGVQSVRKFKRALEENGITRSDDGKVVDNKGRNDEFLNDFSRNISKPTSYLMSDNNKEQAMKILAASKFPIQQIQNKMKVTYNSQSQAVKNLTLQKTTLKRKKFQSTVHPLPVHIVHPKNPRHGN